MRFGFGRLLLSGALVGAVGFASAQITKSGAGYLFRMKFAKGMTRSYMIETKGSFGAQQFTSRVPISQKITAVKGDVASMTLHMGQLTVISKGRTQPFGGKGQDFNVKVNSQGVVQGQDGGMGGQLAMKFPSGPISVGKVWTDNTSATVTGGQSVSVKTTYKFVGIERVGGKNMAKVALTMKSSGSFVMNGSGTTWLDMSDGSIYKNVTKMTTEMGESKIPSTTTVTRR